MSIFIYLFLAVGIMLILWAGSDLFIKERAYRTKLPYEKAELKMRRLRSLIAFAIPFTKAIMEKIKVGEKIKNKLDAGHSNLKPEEFLSLKVILAVVFMIASAFLFRKEDFLILGIVGLFGFFLPDIWLKNKIRQRRSNIVRVLPETVDLLGLCIEAGLDFTTAVRWVIEKAPRNPMIDELALVLEQIKWGRPRTQALKDMAKRLNVSEVTSLVQTMVQSEKMGTPVSQTFTILSEDTRLQRYNRGERIALKAPIKMLVPLIFCILPVIAIVVAGPILLQFMSGEMLKGF